jgi:hypothetical protein
LKLKYRQNCSRTKLARLAWLILFSLLLAATRHLMMYREVSWYRKAA